MSQSLFILGEEVGGAMAGGRAVVALESTVIAHGLPRPRNVETARRLEQIVRDAGATPATVAVLGGRIHVGLSGEQIELIGRGGGDVRKLSRRDLPAAVALGWDGATTVATTAWVAERAGVRVFSTGGIGGVHRGNASDVSADLPELARSSLVVVCSGAKSVLDLPATREWLETYGVTVVGFGCDDMPAFYTRRSGLKTDVRADSAREVARLSDARRRLGLEGALLLTVPVPEASEVDGRLLQSVLDEAVAEAGRQGISGRDLTPFLLARVAERTGGATLETNVALLENNARVAAEVALALAESEI